MTTSSTNQILLGATVGCLMGTTYMLLSNPKIKRKINGVYHDLSDRAQDYADQAQGYLQDAIDQGQDVYNNASRFAKKAKKKTSKYLEQDNLLEEPRLNLVAGAIGGVLLGAAAIYFFSNREEEPAGLVKQARASCNRAASKLNGVDWVETAKGFLHTINENLNHEDNDEDIQKLTSNNKTLTDVIQLANLGVRFWNNIKRR